MIGGEGSAANWFAVLALLITLAVASVVGTKAFRWEKEEKIAEQRKLWILACSRRSFSWASIRRRRSRISKIQNPGARSASRSRSILFQNARIFVGNGTVIPNGAVLIKNGKIAQVFGTPPADTKAFDAEVDRCPGETLMPGLIDMHVHIGRARRRVSRMPRSMPTRMLLKRTARRLSVQRHHRRSQHRRLAGYLAEAARGEVNSGKYLGARTLRLRAAVHRGGRPSGGADQELSRDHAKTAQAEFLRQPKSPPKRGRRWMI